jgi:hypothetical protein
VSRGLFADLVAPRPGGLESLVWVAPPVGGGQGGGKHAARGRRILQALATFCEDEHADG